MNKERVLNQNKVGKLSDITKLIKDGDTVTTCGIIGALVPEKVLAALEKRFLETGFPRNLTAVFPIAVGDIWELPGADHFAHEGLIKRVIGGSYVTAPASGPPPKLVAMVHQNRVED